MNIELIICIISIASLIRAMTGFGDALFAMPLLLLILPSNMAIPLFALCGGMTGLILVIVKRKKINLHSTKILIISSLIGIPIGIFFLKRFDDSVMKIAIGLLLIFFSIYMMFVKSKIKLTSNISTYFFGLISGILGGAYNTNGPPIVIYGRMRGWKKQEYLSTLQAYYLISSIFIIFSHGVSGMFTSKILNLYFISIPFSLFSIAVGIQLNNKVPEKYFNYFINIMISIVGVTLIIQNLF
ncbi:MAG: sulfite exporter TauE/SafE family protein [Bdellovibrionales bacterium]|jgi:uncharacterized protein|nr:sulfite exporter TauE/SafE family protein [Bdellovibrionales bacterium]